MGNTYQGALRWGVENACLRHDVDLMVYVGRTDWTSKGDQHKIFYLVDPTHVDAIVIASGVIAPSAPLEEVVANIQARCPVPICSIGQHCLGVSNILVDNERGTSQLVDHLVKHHGRRHFVCIAGPVGHRESERWIDWTRRSLKRQGLTLPPEALVRGDFLVSSGNDAVCQLLDQGIDLEVVLCANDDMAVGALDAVTTVGLRCPTDVVITGFDDTIGAHFSAPSLTTVRQPVTRLGAMAVDHVIRMLDGETVRDGVARRA